MTVEFTHLDKVWPEERYTKGDVITYYGKIVMGRSRLTCSPILRTGPKPSIASPMASKGSTFTRRTSIPSTCLVLSSPSLCAPGA